MAKRYQPERTEPSRKQQMMTRRERQQAQRVTIGVAAAVGAALVLVIVGVVVQLLLIPQSAVALVDNSKIATGDYQNRTQFAYWQSSSQLANLLQFQQQFDPSGEQGFFTSQIQQLQGELSNAEGFANNALEDMIDEELMLQAAEGAGVSVTDEEVANSLQELIASRQQAVTAPQATATAEALAVATATPTATPSPTPTTTVTSTVTAPVVTPEPTPTVHVITQTEYDDGYEQLIEEASQGASISKAQATDLYRRLLSLDLLRTKLLDTIGDQMPKSGERVRARHILIALEADADQATQELALAKAISITQRLEAGEDFATLAEQFSDDEGSAARGGDLGFFSRGQMVAPFEEAAFSLPIGEISEPVKSDFGYHIIKVEEQDDGEPDFNLWLQERKAAATIERRLTDARLPQLPALNPALLQSATSGTAATPSLPIVTTLEPAPAVTPAATPGS